MTPDGPGRALRIVEEALDLDQVERAAFVRVECAGDAALEEEVLALLEEDDDETFLRPPIDTSASVDLAERFVGRRLGDFTIERVVASGGMGTVFAATQAHPRRTVALKILRPTLSSPSAIGRFREEAEILGRLDHPGIAKIHDAGCTTEAGLEVPWFAMEYVEGARDVLAYAAAAGLETRARVVLFREILDAVRHGHRSGVIHRDLKPSNLLVDARGRPRVIDFGVARVLDAGADVLRTATGELVGTLKYMSPEQFEAESGSVDTRTDVFSLGVVLYELLVGRAPLDLTGKSVIEIAHAVREGRIIPPRSVSPSLPEDLDWIIRRALDPERDQRYEGAGAFADDLGRWLRDEPVQAGPPSARYRLRKFVRRHKLGISVAALVVVLFVSGLLGTVVNWREAVRRRAEAEEESRQATAATEFFAEMLQTADPWEEEPDLRVSDLLDRAAGELGERFAGAPEREAMLRRVLGRTYLRLGRHEAAEEQLRIARGVARPGRGSPDRLGFHLAQLHARALRGLWRHDEGRRLTSSALAEAEPALGLGAPEVVELRVELARQWRAIGRGEEALAALEPLLPRLESASEESEEDRRIIGSVYAQVLLDVGRPQDAMQAADELVELARRGGSRPGPSLAYVMGLRARILARLARWGEAHDDLRRASALFAEHLGPTHLTTLQARLPEAQSLMETSDFRGAEALMRDVLETLDSEHGLDGIDTADERELLAEILMATGRFAEARGLLGDALEDRRRVVGDRHLRVLESRAALGGCLAQMGDLEGGAREIEAVIEQMCLEWNPMFVRTTEAVRFSIERFFPYGPESVALFEQLLWAVRGREGVDAYAEGWVAHALAGRLRGETRLSDAQAVVEDTLFRLERSGVDAESLHASLRRSRAVILGLRGDLARAEPEFRAAAEAFRRMGDDGWYTGTLRSLAYALEERGRDAEAEALYRRIAALDLGDESFVGAQARFSLAMFADRRLDDGEGARLYRAAAEMTRRTDPELWAAAVDGLAQALLSAGRVDEARRTLEEFEAGFPATSCSPTLHTLETLYHVLGEEEAELRLARRLDATH